MLPYFYSFVNEWGKLPYMQIAERTLSNMSLLLSVLKYTLLILFHSISFISSFISFFHFSSEQYVSYHRILSKNEIVKNDRLNEKISIYIG